MDKLETLLKEISKIVVREKTQQEEKRKRGENFNIFKVLGLSTSEVRLHSAFLAELLNPNGDHGLGDRFLKSFIDNVIGKRCNFPFECNSAKVYVEYFIGNITSDNKEGGRIDLLLRDKNMQTIIIENKIYADDQPWQMYRYNTYASKTEGMLNEQYVLLYLTLQGSSPSDYSTGTEKFDYFCISYREDILRWLECCVGIAALYPSIRETIRQYIINIKNVLSIMDTNNNQEFLSILTSKDNINTTINILEHGREIQSKIREEFAKQIETISSEFGFKCTIDEGIMTANNNSWIRITDETYPGIDFRIGVESHTNQDGFRMVFTSNIPCKYKDTLSFWADGEKPNEKYPLGWKYLWSETGIPGSGHWWRWDEWPTLRDMANGKMIDYFKQQLERIQIENAFQRIKKMQVANR